MYKLVFFWIQLQHYDALLYLKNDTSIKNWSPTKNRRMEFIKKNKDKKENILTMRLLKLSWQYLAAKTAVTKNVPNILHPNRNCSTEYQRWFNEVYLNKR